VGNKGNDRVWNASCVALHGGDVCGRRRRRNGTACFVEEDRKGRGKYCDDFEDGGNRCFVS